MLLRTDQRDHPGSDEAKARTPARVLVIDDTPAQRYAVAQRLRRAGYLVIEAESGREGIAAASREAVDAVIVDVRMPDIDGLEVCARLKATSAALLPVVILSSEAISRAAREAGLAAGADAYLVHPFNPTELCTLIDGLVGIRRAALANADRLATNELLQQSLDALASHVAVLDPRGDLIAVNAAWSDFAELNGATRAMGLGANYFEVCERARGAGAEDARLVAAGIRDVLDGRADRFEHTYTCHAPDEERWFRVTVRPLRRPGVDQVAALVLHRNRTIEVAASRQAGEEQERAEAARIVLDRQAALFRALTELSTELTCILDPDGALRYLAPSVTTTLGYRDDELLYTSAFDLVHADDRALAEGAFVRLVGSPAGTSANVALRLRRSDGAWRVFEGSAVNLIRNDAVRGVTWSLRDVTGRVSAERARRMAESRFRAFVETVRDVIWAVDDRGVTTYVNPSIATIAGYEPDELRDRPIAPFFDAETRAIVDAAVRSNKALDPIEATLLRADGRPVEVLLSAAPLDYPAGEAAMILTLTDISDRAASERRLRDQFSKLPVPTLLWEARGTDLVLLDLNEAAENAFAPVSRASIGKRAAELFPEALDVAAACFRSLRENVVVHMGYLTNDAVRREDRTFDLTIGPQLPDRVLVHAAETTQHLRLANELRQSQKMEAVGRLAGGIAHDFNNLLTVIGAHGELLRDALPDAAAGRANAAAILRAADRAAGLTRQLLAFSRKQMLNPETIDLNLLVREGWRMLGRVLGEDIEVRLDVSSDALAVLVDASQIDQVMLNLAVNARDAMPGGGQLTITTRRVAIDEHAGLPGFVEKGEYARLSLSDTGTGMDDDTRSRIFEPFFTTKEPGKGTGLGLSTVYGIVKQSGGYILVSSAPGEGTTFDVYFPLTRGCAATEEETQRKTTSGRAGGQCVLLVEDDDALRDVARRILVREGYLVLEASSARDALETAKVYRGPIDLLLTDAVMPGMSGAELIKGFRVLRPDASVMLMSGYTDDEITRRGILVGDVAFLPKPFTPDVFAREVRAVLSRRSSQFLNPSVA